MRRSDEGGDGGGDEAVEEEVPQPPRGGRGSKREQIQQLGGALSNAFGFKF